MSPRNLEVCSPIVIYNSLENTFFVARDRYGIKPLYMYRDEENIIFSSEIRPILKNKNLDISVDSSRFDEFLIFGYAGGNRTLYKDIYQVNPGQKLNISFKNCTSNSFWEPLVRETQLNEAEATDKLEHLIKEAVRLWMVSDVEVGSLMSGGVDSPLVTKLAKDLHPDIKIFSVGFTQDKEIDETHNIMLLKEHLDTELNFLKLDDSVLNSYLEELAFHFDEPILDPNNLTLLGICKSIREISDLKVVLCGEGADEICAGYGRHRVLSKELSENHNLETLVYGLNRVALPRLEKLRSGFIKPNLTERFDIASSIGTAKALESVLEYDQKTFLTTRLHSQDRVGMYQSFEIRTPLLEHELTEFINTLPADYKINGDWGKYLLRKVSSRHIPDEVAFDKRKVGLSIPYTRMFKDGVLRKELETRVLNNSNSKLLEHYSKDGVQELLNEHQPYVEGLDHSNTLWRLLALELWLNSFS